MTAAAVSLLGLAVAGLVLLALARWVGLGRCIRCARSIAPWQLACRECRS